jgi:C-8 sterol isomerase
VIDGELWYFKEERPWQRIVHKAGDRYYLAKHQSEALRISDRAWVLEYARGPIISILPFGLAGSLFTTLDFKTIFRIIGIYGKLVIKELFRFNY